MSDVKDLSDLDKLLIDLVDMAYPQKTHDNAAARLILNLMVQQEIQRWAHKYAEQRCGTQTYAVAPTYRFQWNL